MPEKKDFEFNKSLIYSVAVTTRATRFQAYFHPAIIIDYLAGLLCQTNYSICGIGEGIGFSVTEPLLIEIYIRLLFYKGACD